MSELTEIERVVIAGIIALMFLVGIPLGQWIAYRRDCKKYGKEIADEFRRRF